MSAFTPISAKGWFWRIAAILLLLGLGAWLIWSAIMHSWLAGFPEYAALKERYTWLAKGEFWLGISGIFAGAAILVLSIRRDNAASRAARQCQNSH